MDTDIDIESEGRITGLPRCLGSLADISFDSEGI